jgi:integrase
MARGLTAKAIENAKPGPTRREIPDAGCRGLYLVVQPSGARSWAVRYRHEGQSRKLTLPGLLSLAAARKQATAALAELAGGVDPATKERQSKASAAKANAERARDTFLALSRQFLDLYAAKKTRENTYVHYKRMLEIAGEHWGAKSIHEIRRRDIVELLDKIAVDRPVLANRTLAVLSKFFRWLAGRDVVESSPCVGVERPAEEIPRDRVLSDDELRRLWLACDQIGGRIGAFVKVLLLTGQRRSEVAGIEQSEIEGDLWTLPSERVKNARVHVVPLARQVVEIIDSQPPVEKDYVFTGSKRKRIGSFTRYKDQIDAIMKPDSPWVFHDLRRTCASGMSRLGVSVPVVEKVLNHAGGTFAGVVGTYNRYDHLPEKRAALQRWADHVEAIVNGNPAQNVVQLMAL